MKIERSTDIDKEVAPYCKTDRYAGTSYTYKTIVHEYIIMSDPRMLLNGTCLYYCTYCTILLLHYCTNV